MEEKGFGRQVLDHLAVGERADPVHLLFPRAHYRRFLLRCDEVNSVPEILVDLESPFLVVVRQRALVIPFTHHEHVRVVAVVADLVDQQVVKDGLIAQPLEAIEQDAREIDPHSTVLLNQGDPENVGLFLDRVPISSLNHFLKPLILF